MAASIKRWQKHPVSAAPYWLVFELNLDDFADDAALDRAVRAIDERRFTLDEALTICRRNGVDI